MSQKKKTRRPHGQGGDFGASTRQLRSMDEIGALHSRALANSSRCWPWRGVLASTLSGLGSVLLLAGCSNDAGPSEGSSNEAAGPAQNGTGTPDDPGDGTSSGGTSGGETSTGEGAPSSGGSGGGNAPDPLALLSAEFESPDELDAFIDFAPARYLSVDVSDGEVCVVPDNSIARNGWFEGEHAPFFYKQVSGPFVAQLRVRVFDTANPSSPPPPNFKAGGLVIRDPAGTTAGETDFSAEFWEMFNIGNNDNGTRLELKTTQNSSSNIWLHDVECTDALLSVCRLPASNRLRFFHKACGAADWTEAQANTFPYLDGLLLGSDYDFGRVSRPDDLQVGFIGHNWGEDAAGTVGASNATTCVDSMRFSTPTSLEDCTTDLVAR